jgi:hypothetical protein
MSTQRKTDTNTRKSFRTDRFFCQDGAWYFHTREGTVEGPYATRKSAEQYLQTFIALSKLSSNLDLTLEPADCVPPPPPKGKRAVSKSWDFDQFQSKFGTLPARA